MTEDKLKPDFSKPFVFFRKPGTKLIHYWKTNEQARLHTLEHIVQSDKAWWVVAPFLFFRNQQLWAFSCDESKVFEWDALTQWEILSRKCPADVAVWNDTQQADFTGWVSKATEYIGAGKFSKTALSKTRYKNLSPDYNWIDWFRGACEKFPQAMVFFVHIPGAYTWAGATPELFLSANENVVSSVSLAGTLHPQSNDDWTSKEHEEQLFVTQYIRDVFMKSGFVDVQVAGPETVAFGKLRHLKTIFRATWRGKAEIAALVNHLHPTPAVGGLPKYEGVEFILENETHERLWYSGFIGSVEAKSLELFVNLRSMRVTQNGTVLYAGAGITSLSNPYAEWLETENKLVANWDLLQ